MKKIKKGFTLIELLVVVLIIGILAAVALPQYRKAIDKTRLQEAVLIAKDLYRANQRRQMAAGDKEIYLWDELDIDVPAGFVLLNNGKYQKGIGYQSITVSKISSDTLYVYMYPSRKDLNFGIHCQLPARGIRCAWHNNEYTKSLCASLGATAENDYYIMR